MTPIIKIVKNTGFTVYDHSERTNETHTHTHTPFLLALILIKNKNNIILLTLLLGITEIKLVL